MKRFKKFLAGVFSFLIRLFKIADKINDGFHTFDELYRHRMELYSVLLSVFKEHAWKSMYHSDGSIIPGWFVAGVFTKSGEQVTYHLPMSYWDRLGFVKILDRAPEFDGHTSDDVLKRLECMRTNALINDVIGMSCKSFSELMNEKQLIQTLKEEYNGSLIVQDKKARVALDEVLQFIKEHRMSRERSLAITNIQQAIMWLGMDLKALGEANPYPQSYNPSNEVVEPTADGLKM